MSDTPRPALTSGKWEVTEFTLAGDVNFETVDQVAEMCARSARLAGGTRLFGVTLKDDPQLPPRVICYTGNGKLSEAHAKLIAEAVNRAESRPSADAPPVVTDFSFVDKRHAINYEGAAVQPPAPTLVIRCSRCDGTCLFKRLPNGEIRVIHGCQTENERAQAAEITRLREALAGVASYARYEIRRVIDSAASHQEFKLEAQEAWDKMERALEGKQ